MFILASSKLAIGMSDNPTLDVLPKQLRLRRDSTLSTNQVRRKRKGIGGGTTEVLAKLILTHLPRSNVVGR